MNPPKISIIVAAYRASSTLDATLQSVAAQSFDNWECLIIDDASDDETRRRALEWRDKDHRFRVLTSAVNGGPALARNLGLQAARGEWISILDADDLFEVDRLSTLLRGTEALGVEIIFDNQWLLDSLGHRRRWLKLEYGALQQHRLTRFLYQVCGFSPQHWGIAQPLFRRSLLEHPPLRYDPELRFGEDVLLMTQMILRAQCFGVCGYPGYVYRLPAQTGKNLSLANTVDGALSTRKMIDALGTSIGRAAKTFLKLRLLHFELANWRSEISRSIRTKNYLLTILTVTRNPRGWLWLVLNACRGILP
ncbi:MAG: glycosyltransferase family 2 protein [Gammaproteobacteria bacterium]|nr:glycosyltransferase family 2 protein [Gammaproteobacteria bacterium]